MTTTETATASIENLIHEAAAAWVAQGGDLAVTAADIEAIASEAETDVDAVCAAARDAGIEIR